MTLETYVRDRLQEKDLLVMAHVVCGYPSFEANWQALEIMEEAGVDLVELQFPFSEPSADGPLFVKANQLSLQNGTTVAQCFEFMKKVSARFSFRVMMMGYFNTVYRLGYANFLSRLKDAGGCAYILPDLPVEEAGELHQLSSDLDLAPIMLMTPTNSDARLAKIASAAQGFVYVVARKGVTGGATDMDDELGALLIRCRAQTDLPLGVGFGISKRADLEFLRGKADIAIIGSAALRAWEAGGADALRDFFSELLA